MLEVQQKIGAAKPYICGGTPRDRFMGRLDNISDLDICTGDKTVDYLSQEFDIELRKQYDVTRKTMEDGHSTIFVGDLKMDFSSNFVVPGIDAMLIHKGITKPTDLQREMFSRDFTCNTLLLEFDLKTMHDPTGRGYQDIKDKKIRTCLDPKTTLTSNRNRVIRAVYLSAKLGFDIDDGIVNFVRQNPESVKISTDKAMSEKLTEAFKKDPDRAAHALTQLGLWNYIPIPEAIYPYYLQHVKGKPNVPK